MATKQNTTTDQRSLPFNYLRANTEDVKTVFGMFQLGDTHNDSPAVVNGDGFSVSSHATVEGVYEITINDPTIQTILFAGGNLGIGTDGTDVALEGASAQAYLDAPYLNTGTRKVLIKIAQLTDGKNLFIANAVISFMINYK